MKIIFLDIDGVLNSEQTFKEKENFPDLENELNTIDVSPKKLEIFKRILKETNAEIVLSSTWRKSHRLQKDLDKIGLKFIDKTPSCCTGIRGVEIYSWISKNIAYSDRDKLKYVILDDDGDMLLWQKDNFFQTSFKTGLTEEIANKVIKHLNT